jgi:hypothetical protein
MFLKKHAVNYNVSTRTGPVSNDTIVRLSPTLEPLLPGHYVADVSNFSYCCWTRITNRLRYVSRRAEHMTDYT